jgi:hypothetical protein
VVIDAFWVMFRLFLTKKIQKKYRSNKPYNNQKIVVGFTKFTICKPLGVTIVKVLRQRAELVAMEQIYFLKKD